jgi:hypothetical protein
MFVRAENRFDGRQHPGYPSRKSIVDVSTVLDMRTLMVSCVTPHRLSRRLVAEQEDDIRSELSDFDMK